MTTTADLLPRVRAWIDDDPDPSTASELRVLLDASDLAALHARFDAPLHFGTAGLRGAIGAGPARMNRAVVARTTAAVCAHLVETVPDARVRGLAIGFDGRHMSSELAEETAAVAAGAGFAVHVFDTVGPTPLLAFAVLECKAAAGVMITASHNPAPDNGYKLYWANGAQIIPPHDRAIEAKMRTLASVRALPRCDAATRAQQGMQHALGAALRERYFDAVVGPASSTRQTLRIGYTAMHGVGEPFAREALARAGFHDVVSVAEQATPDPDFPTVAFPNPEEPGAMDRVLALCRASGAAIAIANDPDADRLAVAARDANDELRMLTGNEVGALLVDFTLRRAPKPALALCSIVSTPLAARIARAHGAHWEPTLTGFKWIENRALELEAQGRGLLALGFEEALGYAVSARVRDKDGISAAVAIAQLAAEHAARNETLLEALDALFAQHGAYASAQISLRTELPRMTELMARARSTPPRTLAGRNLVARIDLRDGSRSGEPSFDVTLPSSDVLIWELEGGLRVALRPSGTEPKLKVYLDVRAEVAPGEPVAYARQRASALLEALSADVRATLGL